MTDKQAFRIGSAVVIAGVGVFLGLHSIAQAIRDSKPEVNASINLIEKPTTVKVIDGPRPVGLLPEAR